MLKIIFKTTDFLLLAFILFYFSGCKKETIPTSSSSYNYFPVTRGKWVEYSVDSIYHSENDNNNDDSVYSYHFQIREEIDTSFMDGAGRMCQVLKRFKRDSTEAWSLTDVWTQLLTPSFAYRTENNICFHKLSFPINSSTSWNGNDSNTLEEEMYFYEYYHDPATFNSLNFDSVISIIQVDENNFVEKIYGNEVYAAGVGLIYKERDELGKRNGIVVSGLEYRMEVIAYGNY